MGFRVSSSSIIIVQSCLILLLLSMLRFGLNDKAADYRVARPVVANANPDSAVRPTNTQQQLDDQMKMKASFDDSQYVVRPPKGEKWVISMGVYGRIPKYIVGALRNAELLPYIFPGWYLRIYYDQSAHPALFRMLNGTDHVEFIDMTNDQAKGNIAGMFWRFYVADDPSVHRYLIRDSDSRLNIRDAKMVKAWVESGKPYHIVRDHPHHSPHRISGGMWGGTLDPTIGMRKKISQWTGKSQYIQDMSFLAERVYPEILLRSIAYDAYSCEACGARCPFGKFSQSAPFPGRRLFIEAVGQRFDEYDAPLAEDWHHLVNEPDVEPCNGVLQSYRELKGQ